MENQQITEIIPVFNFQLWVRTMSTGTMLLDEESRKKYYLNLTGSYILSKCDGTLTIAEIIQDVYENFSPLTKEDAQEDIINILKHLKKRKIITFKKLERKSDG